MCYHSFNLLKSRSPPLRVYCPRLVAHFVLAFASPPLQSNLGWPRTITRRLIMQKASGHPAHLNSVQMGNFKSQISNLKSHFGQRPNGLGSHTLYANGFRYCFTPLEGVLFTFPSRYWFTIGCQGGFSLIPWSGRIHAEFHVHRITWDTSRRPRTSHTRLSRSSVAFSKTLCSSLAYHIEVPLPRRNKFLRFGLFRFRSPLLTESFHFLFLGLLRCFTSPRIALLDYEFIQQ